MPKHLTFNSFLPKRLLLVAFLLPFATLGQVTITGCVLNQADTKPVANASVFLSNASVGNKTANDGTFVLTGVKPGKYELVVSIIGFDTYRQTITAESSNISIPDILIFPKTIALSEVKITPKTDPNRELYYDIFKKEFLGESDLAKECKILNPEVLDFEYDDKQSRLTASSIDFLIIENAGLGYRVRYLLTNFTKDSKNEERQSVHYEGSSFFENLEGSASQKRAWEKKRQEAYEGSPKHFLRAALNNRLDEEGFRVLQYATYQNPQRPPDDVIAAKIKFFKEVKDKDSRNIDSLSFWERKQKLKKTLTGLMKYPLNKEDLVRLTEKKGIYAISCENDGLHVTYNKSRRFSSIAPVQNLNDPYNKDVTLVNFNTPVGYFDDNGVYTNPNALLYTGAWAKKRMAELLPSDYTPLQANTLPADNSTAVKSPGDKLADFKDKHITEHTYLHFDKPYYAAGDTIYFKAYVTMGERRQLTQLSGVLHVDLINTQNKIDQSLLLKITDGVCWGDFALPDSLPKGEYRVRAYTNWMRNEGENGFYRHTIPVGSALATKIPESATALPAANKPDLQFFPESGNLVSGLKSKIAFKAIGPNGLGVDVKGSVTDNTGKVITTFASAHLGMGFFEIVPEAGKNYKAEVTFADGLQNTIGLPVSAEQGLVLTVNNDSLQKVSIAINADKVYFQQNKSKEYNLLIYSGGTVTTVKSTLDSAVIRFDVAKRRLHTGVNTVTLFSPDGQPVAERLFFVQNYDKLNLAISGDKTTYLTREKVNIRLNAKNRADSLVAGHFSISVIDEGKVPVDENSESTILSNLLLTDDLKGNVEQPNYYFNNITAETLKNLDLVMLTHGYRGFEWKEVLAYNNQPLKYQSEKDLEINGVAKTLLGKPLANGMVSLISTGSGQVLSGKTDEAGHFKFSNLEFSDSTHFILQAAKTNGSNKTQLIYEPSPVPGLLPATKISADVNQQLSVYLQNTKAQLNEYTKYGSPKGIMLREVYVNQQKARDKYRSSVLGGSGHADQVVHMDDIKTGGTLVDKLNGILRGVMFSNNNSRTTASLGVTYVSKNDAGMLVVVDGVVEPSPFDINNLAPNDVETVEVLKYANTSIYGSNAGHGVLVFTTRIGKLVDKKDIPSFGILPITPKGFYHARVFYSPRYDSGDANLKKKDLRPTIYWNPELLTDKDGNASIDFYNADAPGSYRVVVEGINDRGNLGRQVYRYTVK